MLKTIYIAQGQYLRICQIIFLNQVRQIAKQEKSIFFKIEPENKIGFKEFGFKESSKQIQPHKQ